MADSLSISQQIRNIITIDFYITHSQLALDTHLFSLRDGLKYFGTRPWNNPLLAIGKSADVGFTFAKHAIRLAGSGLAVHNRGRVISVKKVNNEATSGKLIEIALRRMLTQHPIENKFSIKATASLPTSNNYRKTTGQQT
jgi:hypothetical protein